jgi:hypothetical protein
MGIRAEHEGGAAAAILIRSDEIKITLRDFGRTVAVFGRDLGDAPLNDGGLLREALQAAVAHQSCRIPKLKVTAVVLA